MLIFPTSKPKFQEKIVCLQSGKQEVTTMNKCFLLHIMTSLVKSKSLHGRLWFWIVFNHSVLTFAFSKYVMTSLLNNNSFSAGFWVAHFFFKPRVIAVLLEAEVITLKIQIFQFPHNTHTTTLVYARQYSFWMLCTTLLWSLPSSLLVPYFPTLMPSIQCLPLSVIVFFSTFGLYPGSFRILQSIQ